MERPKNGSLRVALRVATRVFGSFLALTAYAARAQQCDVVADPDDHVYVLSESTAQLTLWTAPVAHRVGCTEGAPTAIRSGAQMAAAGNEFEPLQIVLDLNSGPATDATVSVAPFPALGPGQRTELRVGECESGLLDRLTPLANPVSLDVSTPLSIWLTVYVPAGSTPGLHSTALTVTVSGSSPIVVPIQLEVFDFDLPASGPFQTELNVPFSFPEEDFKTALFERRMTPKSPTWPSGFQPNITWDTSANPNRCLTFWDEPTEDPLFGLFALAPKYLLGTGWNGVGFPSARLYGNGSAGRPQVLCGESIGPDPLGTAGYNAEWSSYLAAVQGYVAANGYSSRGYYNVHEAPAGSSEDALIAHLCRLSRDAAPTLRRAVGASPRPTIAEDAGGACGFDLWQSPVVSHDRDYAVSRIRDFGEEVWFSSLDNTAAPTFDPVTFNKSGANTRITAWVSWAERVRGWTYFNFGSFYWIASDPGSGVRVELLRESFEDYAYLWLANGSAHPSVDLANTPDLTVASVARNPSDWDDDPVRLAALRAELGRFVEGSRAEAPCLAPEGATNPRGSYFLNFQDPGGEPTADPLIVDGDEYTKVGWDAFDLALGYGWSGPAVGDPSTALSGFSGDSSFTEVERSWLTDDFGRENLFRFNLEPGRYLVTLGVGRAGTVQNPHNATVENVVIVDDEPTTAGETILERQAIIDLVDGQLSFEIGGPSASTGNPEFTFLAYARIEPDPPILACPDPDPTDTDADGNPDACDEDDDGDGLLDTTEILVGLDSLEVDSDGDGSLDGVDNCVRQPNALQTDTDGDGRGDSCDAWDAVDLSNPTPRTIGLEFELTADPAAVGVVWINDPVDVQLTSSGDLRTVILPAAQWETLLTTLDSTIVPGSASSWTGVYRAGTGELESVDWDYLSGSGERFTYSGSSLSPGGLDTSAVPGLVLFCSTPPCDVPVPVVPHDPITGEAHGIGGLDVPSLNALPPPNDFFVSTDVRLSAFLPNSDPDNDGLTSGEERAIGTNLFDADSDSDGIDDFAEVNIIGTDPLNDDTDGDGIVDGFDNCPFVTGSDPSDSDGDGVGDFCDNCRQTPNLSQADNGGFGPGLTGPDGVGDRCQNGDYNGDGIVDIIDSSIMRRQLAGAPVVLEVEMPPEPQP